MRLIRPGFCTVSSVAVEQSSSCFELQAKLTHYRHFPDARILLELCYKSPHVRKAHEGPMGCVRAPQWGIIRLSRLFTTRARAERERDKLEATFTYKKVSLGVGFVAKE